MRPHDIYINETLLPITPSKITTKIKNKNNVVNLINGDDLNQLKKPGLTEYNFQVRLPHEEFPSVDNFVEPPVILELLEKLKTEEKKEGEEEDPKVFQFIVIRNTPGLVNSVNEKVTLEDYDIIEDAKEGRDILVDIFLKKYIPLKTKKLDWKEFEGKLEAIADKLKKPVAPEPAEVLYAKEKAKKEAEEATGVSVKTSLTEKPPVNIDGKNMKKVIMHATAYTPSPRENGGYNTTAKGNPLTPYKYCAVDPKVYPYGTKFYVPEFKDSPYGGVFIADDCGGAIKGNKIDLLLPDTATARKFGRKREYEMYIVE